MRKRVLIPRPLNHLPGAEEILEKEIDIIRSPGIKENDLLQVVGTVHGLIATGAVAVSKKVIEEAPLLQVIAAATVGFDKIDVEAASRAGIPVVANTGVAPGPVAEFTIGLVIALARRILRADRDLRRTKDWAARARYADPYDQMGADLQGCTAGIVGLGNIGSEVARRLKAAFSTRILGYDPYVSHEQMTACGVEKTNDLLKLAREVDFLLVHVPLNKETRHLIHQDILRAMKPSAFLINCARGPVVDETSLIRALKEGWIAGAALDVFEEEPIRSDNPMLTMDNVILTPHIAGVSVQSTKLRGAQLAKRLLSVFAGERPEGLVNPDVWPRFLERFSINCSP
jgi:D-3-phosphoglycerate dehydrogenase